MGEKGVGSCSNEVLTMWNFEKYLVVLFVMCIIRSIPLSQLKISLCNVI